MAFLTDAEIKDIRDNKHCAKCGNAALEAVRHNEYSTFAYRAREIDFECQTCGFTVRYVRKRPVTRQEVLELCEKRKKAELSFIDSVIAKFKVLIKKD